MRARNRFLWITCKMTTANHSFSELIISKNQLVSYVNFNQITAMKTFDVPVSNKASIEATTRFLEMISLTVRYGVIPSREAFGIAEAVILRLHVEIELFPTSYF